MAIKRFLSNKDNVITNAYKFDLQRRATKSNMGQSDIIEVFSIFGQQSKKSVEKMRTLIEFPVDEVVLERNSGNIPKSGSVNFVLKLFNAEHGQSVPKNFTVDVLPIAQQWEEGFGLDMETYLDTGASNWLSSSDASTAQISKFTFLSASAYDYRGSSVTLYEQDGDRYNFWFKHHATSSAPALDGTEQEVDIIGKVTPAEVATAFRNFVNPINGFSAVSEDGDASVVYVTNTTAGLVTDYSFNSLPTSTITGQVTQRGKSAVLWTSEGGSTWNLNNIKDAGFSSYTQNFVSGREHLEVDITGLVEEWIKGETGSGLEEASGSISFTDTPEDNSTITVISTDGLRREYRFLSSGITNAETGSSDSSVIFVDTSSGNTTTIASNFVSALTNINAHDDRFTGGSNAALVHLTQSVAGFGGNTKITQTGDPKVTANTYLSGGAGAINNGLLIGLQGAYENGTLATSFYTKKFFARGSEFELKRPVLEARWDSSVTDDRNDFYMSSSLLSGEDNLNSLYLYNYFRGTLKNIPSIGTGSIYVKLNDKSGNEITSSSPYNPVTGTYVSPGIYKASFALLTTGSVSDPITDIWFSGASQYHTGKFYVKSHSSKAHRPDFTYVSKLLNLKSSYTVEEKPRLRLHIRERDWSPNIYTVASKKIETSVVRNAYYKITRVSDAFPVVSYGTGSVEYTKLSYDVSGSYFDVDMSIFEKGHLYEISIVYKLDNDYKEQNDKFRFRVD